MQNSKDNINWKRNNSRFVLGYGSWGTPQYCILQNQVTVSIKHCESKNKNETENRQIMFKKQTPAEGVISTVTQNKEFIVALRNEQPKVVSKLIFSNNSTRWKVFSITQSKLQTFPKEVGISAHKIHPICLTRSKLLKRTFKAATLWIFTDKQAKKTWVSNVKLKPYPCTKKNPWSRAVTKIGEA